MLSQYKGVSYHRGIRKWIAQTQHRRKKVYAAFETEDLLVIGVLGIWIDTVSHAVVFRCNGFVGGKIQDWLVGCAVGSRRMCLMLR